MESASLDDYNIHVIGSVFKQWLRDLPNPLLTFELYEEFIRAMGRCCAALALPQLEELADLLCWNGSQACRTRRRRSEECIL